MAVENTCNFTLRSSAIRTSVIRDPFGATGLASNAPEAMIGSLDGAACALTGAIAAMTARQPVMAMVRIRSFTDIPPVRGRCIRGAQSLLTGDVTQTVRRDAARSAQFAAAAK